jgi:hypothetical protein
MPEVIIIDEIGTELEALAARTIAERGVQLIGTAHGNTLENVMLNPTLSDLVGGIQAVTLGDEEAKRRRTQKTILERKSPPTFDIVVEIQDRYRVAVHPDVSLAVDATLRNQPSATETRQLDEKGEVAINREEPSKKIKILLDEALPPSKKTSPKLYPFGINRARLEQAAKEMQLAINMAVSIKDAELMVTSKSYYRRRPQKIRDAEAANLPIYVLRKHTPSQLKQMLATVHPAGATIKSSRGSGALEFALREAEEAAGRVIRNSDTIELSPQSAYIRRLQHLIAERNQLVSRSSGKDPNRRVRIYKE